MKNWYYPDTSSAVLQAFCVAFICGTHFEEEEGEWDVWVGGQVGRGPEGISIKLTAI